MLAARALLRITLEIRLWLGLRRLRPLLVLLRRLRNGRAAGIGLRVRIAWHRFIAFAFPLVEFVTAFHVRTLIGLLLRLMRILLRELRRIARHIIVEVPIEHGVRVGRKIAGGARFGHINFYLPETAVNLLQTSGLRVVRSQICYPSLAYEQYCAGRARGLVMATLRRTALKVSPRLAPWMFTYLFAAFCVPDESGAGDFRLSAQRRASHW